MEKDRKIHQQTAMLDVVKVILELERVFFRSRSIVLIDLSPSGNAGTDQEPGTVKGDFTLQIFDNLRPFRTGTDQTEVAAQYIDKLGISSRWL